MCGGLRHTPCDSFGFGVICVTPGFGLPQEMDHLGIATISEIKMRITCLAKSRFCLYDTAFIIYIFFPVFQVNLTGYMECFLNPLVLPP